MILLEIYDINGKKIQAEMDALVAHVGLHKLEMLIDTQGIFTVSVAQKMISVKSAKA